MVNRKSIRTFFNKSLIMIFFILFCIGIILCFHITMSPDETFSMGLVRYNIPQILHLDTLDVHPPLYYLLLKLFLMCTTFYTSSLAIKVIFARILSVIFSLIGFYILFKIGKLIKIKQSYMVSFLLFTLIPYNLFIVPSKIYTDIGAFTSIRMYSLAFMLISAEFYESLKFKYCGRNQNIIVAILCASLASYTHNVSAIIAGIILFIFMINVHKNNRKFKKFFFSGIIFALLYVPWIPIALKQSISVYQTNNISLSNSAPIILSIIKLLVFLLILSSPVFIHLKYLNKKITSTIYILSIIIVCTSILLILFSPKYRNIYLYPIFTIYLYLCLNIIRNIIETRCKNIAFYSSLLPLFAIILLFILGAYDNNNEYRNPKLYSTIVKYSQTNESHIKLDEHVSTNNKYTVIMLNNDAIYTENHGHLIYNMNNTNIQKHLAATQSKKLRHYIYNNPLRCN